MKIAELFEARKKRKKNRHSWWGNVPFAVVQSGTGDDTIGAGAGITGGSLAESEDHYPKQAMLKDGFYIVRREGKGYENYIYMYEVRRLMDDDTIFAYGGATDDAESPVKSSWVYRRNVDKGILEIEPIGPKDVANFLKFKWWLANKLISSGVVKDAQ
jgi:hypothetical protein